MVFIHEYNEAGSHRLRVQIFQKSDIVGEWAGYTQAAIISIPFGGGDRVFAAHTDWDTSFPPVYEIKQIGERIIVMNGDTVISDSSN